MTEQAAMSPERWRRIKELLADVLERPPADRQAFLEAVCQAEPASVQEEVRELYEVFEEAGDSLEEPWSPAAGWDSEADLAEDRQLGPYRLLDRLGEGGMGLVYLAERVDQEFERQVAIKVLRWRVTGDRLRRRLLAERQILARLQHPNIAALFDGGTVGGQPYLVLEYVEGQAIDVYCDTKRLTIRERIRLLQRVCDAVALAHRSLVLHCDLKPGNILVGSDGIPKVLDFGLAQILSAANADGLRSVVSSIPWMTPEYASPEQARGEPLTTASDIYSLGVLAYELLTGRRPHDLAGMPYAEVLQILGDAEPERPHLAVHPPTGEDIAARRSTDLRHLRRELRGDLGHILLKALEKRPGQRYASAERLAEDLSNYLDELPVRARTRSWSYRMGKFVRRHKLPVALASGLLLTAAVAAGGLLQQYRVILQERDRAERVSDFLVKTFEVADPSASAGKTPTAREILDRAARDLARDGTVDRELRASLFNTLGLVYRSLGLYEESGRFLRSALNLRRRAARPDRQAVAESLQNLGRLLRDTGETAEAERNLRQALEMQIDLYGAESLQTANIQNNLGLVLLDAGRFPETERLFRQALATRTRLLGPSDPKVAESLNNIGSVLDSQGRFKEAAGLYRQALALRKKIFGLLHVETVQSLNNLAVVLHEQGDYPAAVRLNRQVLAINTRLHGRRHVEVVRSGNNLGAALLAQDRVLAAREAFSQAHELATQILPEQHPLTVTLASNLAYTAQATGDYRQAETLFRRALELDVRLHGPVHPDVASDLQNLGVTLLLVGRYEDAEPLLRHAIAMWRRLVGPVHVNVLRAQSSLAVLKLRRGDASAALRDFSEILPRRRQLLGAEHPLVSGTLSNIALCHLRLGDLAAAERFAREAIRIGQKRLPADDSDLASFRSILGEVLLRQGRPNEAARLLEESYQILKASFGPQAFSTRAAAERLAQLQKSDGIER